MVTKRPNYFFNSFAVMYFLTMPHSDYEAVICRFETLESMLSDSRFSTHKRQSKATKNPLESGLLGYKAK